MLSRIALTRGVVDETILTRLDSIVDLEFYMPVAGHLDQWNGDSRLIVVTSLHDDRREPPVGFTLAGERVPGLSADNPPDIPTLVLVPVETNFDLDSAAGAATYADAGGSGPPGIYMTYNKIFDSSLGEGWPNGSPELEVHTSIRNAAGEFVYTVCSGEQQTFDLFFDQDTDTWSGPDVLLIAETAISKPEDIRHEIWEDDNGPCKPNGEGRPPKTNPTLRTSLTTFGVALINIAFSIPTGGLTLIKSVAIGIPAVINLAFAATEDDLIGTIDLIPAQGCFPATGTTRFYAKDPRDPGVQAWVDIDFRFGDERDPICALVTSISGPNAIDIGSGVPVPPANYSAVWSGGQGAGPTFQWRLDGVLKSTSSSYTISPVTEGNHTVHLTVTRGNDTVTDQKTISVTNSCQELFCN